METAVSLPTKAEAQAELEAAILEVEDVVKRQDAAHAAVRAALDARDIGDQRLSAALDRRAKALQTLRDVLLEHYMLSLKGED